MEVGFIPRTGIEQPFIKSIHTFTRNHKEFEPICEAYPDNRALIEDYKLQEQTRTISMNKVVYDCTDNNSPYYPLGDYIDQSKRIPVANAKDVFPYNKS